MRPHKDIEFGWHLMHDRIFADVLPYQYSLDFEDSIGELPTETEDFLRYVHFIKDSREQWRTDWWLKLQLYTFGFLRTIWLMLLMVNISTLVTYTGVMAYFDNSGAHLLGFCMWSVLGFFVVKHCIHCLKQTTSKHYALSKTPILVCATGWAMLSMKDLIYLEFFSISNLPTIAAMWIATMIVVKLTRLEKPIMPTLAFVLLCGISVVGLDELAYITRGFGATSLSRIAHQQSELLYGLWGFQVLYVVLCIVTTSWFPNSTVKSPHP
jgi:hypothetical protein